jgi:hypothetical protein
MKNQSSSEFTRFKSVKLLISLQAQVLLVRQKTYVTVTLSTLSFSNIELHSSTRWTLN